MKLSIEKQRLLVVALLMIWSSGLCLLRMYLGTDWLATGMLWNLFLAFVPLLWSAAFRSALGRGQRVMAAAWFTLWLLFLPNAPYMLTDLIHLGSRRNVAEWYILAMLLSCAGTGMLLAYLSLHDVETALAQRFGARAAWSVATVSLMFSAFGIYLGRYLRWNSWDALRHPLQLLDTIAGQFIDPGQHPHPFDVTLVYGLGLIIGYVALRVLALSMRTGGHA